MGWMCNIYACWFDIVYWMLSLHMDYHNGTNLHSLCRYPNANLDSFPTEWFNAFNSEHNNSICLPDSWLSHFLIPFETMQYLGRPRDIKVSVKSWSGAFLFLGKTLIFHIDQVKEYSVQKTFLQCSVNMFCAAFLQPLLTTCCGRVNFDGINLLLLGMSLCNLLVYL